MLWQEAQKSAGVIGVEPYTAVIGSPAAKKKTWAVADGTLKFFSYGYEPIWFPADVVRRTVCGSDPRWSYFWHALSGDESDLHPWLPGKGAFEGLLGDAGSALPGALDVAACREAYGGTGNEGCLYGEVSASAGFDAWFCGERGSRCRAQVNATHVAVPGGFEAPEALCMHGPFVLERVHGWRPEIHPAELMWARRPGARGAWTIALVPDTSERFDEGKHYDDAGRRLADSWRPWSSERPVELWVAFSRAAGSPSRFDLSRKALGKTVGDARQATFEPPPPGPFKVLPSALDEVQVVSKTWTSGGTERGFLVLRTTVGGSGKGAVVLRLTGRGADEPLPDPEIHGAVAHPGAVPEEEQVGRVRMLGEARHQGAVVGTVAINTLVRFDPLRPSVPPDEETTDRLNEALKGEPGQRRAAFGKERPFRVEWDLTAVQDASGQPVPVERVAPARMIGPPGDRVRVAAFPGPATEEIRVKTDAPQPELAPAEEKPVSLGQLVLSVPGGVTVRGVGRVVYVGTRPLGLAEPALTFTLRYPAWSYANEWELVKDVLTELDPSRASRRVEALRADSCAPAPPDQCPTLPLAPDVAKRLLDPVDRWKARRDLLAGGRPFARFVRLFARNLLWDRRVSNDEREILKTLLKDSPVGRD